MIDAFMLEETLYWWSHPIERVNTVQGVDAWDWYHWLIARQLAQDQDWVALKQYMDTMQETHLREDGRADSIRVATSLPRILDSMPNARQRRRRASNPLLRRLDRLPFHRLLRQRRAASQRRPHFRQNGRGIMSVLAKAYKIGDRLGRDKRYKRMGAKGATGHYRRHPRPWES